MDLMGIKLEDIKDEDEALQNWQKCCKRKYYDRSYGSYEDFCNMYEKPEPGTKFI